MSMNRIARIEESLRSFTEKFDQCPVKVREQLEQHMSSYKVIKRKTTVAYVALTLIYLMLYVSLISAILGDVLFLGEALVLFRVISGIVGTSVLLVIALFINRLLSVYVSDAHTLASIIIATVTKHTDDL